MSAGSYDIYIERGATFTLDIVCLDSNNAVTDLTGCNARMQIRRSINDPTVLDEFFTNPPTPVSPGSLTNELTIYGTEGRISLVIDAEVTSAYTAWKKAVYDLEVIAPDVRFPISGEITRLLEGNVESSPEVTRQVGP